MRAKPAPGGGLPPGKPPPLDLVTACSRCMYSSMGLLLDMVGGAGQPFCAVEQGRLGRLGEDVGEWRLDREYGVAAGL